MFRIESGFTYLQRALFESYFTMASLLDLNSNSSDSENDCDYVPPEGELSGASEEDEYTGPENDVESPKKAHKKRKRNKHETLVIEEEEPIEKPKLTTVDEKKRAESLWKSFLSDVESSTSSRPSSGKCSESTSIASSPLITPEKKTVSEVYEFAGETVTITKEIGTPSASSHGNGMTTTHSSDSGVHSSSASPEIVQNIPPAINKRKGGLTSVIGNIMNKKQKLSTIQKTLYDWKSFKKDEGIEEDLEKYNKGKGGFLEKQAFLQRSDLRSFEREKNVRMSKIRK